MDTKAIANSTISIVLSVVRRLQSDLLKGPSAIATHWSTIQIGMKTTG